MDDEAERTISQSRQLQEKFELYLLALVFTVLGLAVQTAKFDGGPTATGFELAGWLSLLLSGIVGLLRLEKMPSAYGLLANQQAQLRDVSAIRNAASKGEVIISQETGQPVSEGAVLQRKTGAASALAQRFEEVQRAMQRRYAVHKWAFVIGIASLMVSRGYVAAADLFAAVIARG